MFLAVRTEGILWSFHLHHVLLQSVAQREVALVFNIAEKHGRLSNRMTIAPYLWRYFPFCFISGIILTTDEKTIGCFMIAMFTAGYI